MSDTLRRTIGALLLIAMMGGSTLGALLRVAVPAASFAPAISFAPGIALAQLPAEFARR